MRAFIGIDFSSELKNHIAAVQNRLRTYASGGRWKYSDNFHITLKFLGDIRQSQALEICRILKDICSRTSCFSLNISEIGNFPGNGCISVLWLGLGGELKKLNRLQKEIDLNLEGQGFKREGRAYKPHITIGQDILFKEPFENIKAGTQLNAFPWINVDRVILFRSEQILNKRVYTLEAGFLLQGSH